MNHPLATVEIEFENDPVFLRQRVRQVCSLLGFDQLDQARLAAASSEIARNALKYAGGGKVQFAVSDSEPVSLLISVSDKGPGIANLEAVLEGRVSTGLGITSARRMVDSFQIKSIRGRGTTVVMARKLPDGGGPLTAAEVASLAAELPQRVPADPYEEIRRQNQDLVRTMEELRARQEELVRLNRELEDTNCGVVALYAELDEKAMHLRRADELKTRFLSNMSHEFRTPVNSILALSRMLLDRVDGPLTEDQAKQVGFVQQSAQDLSELVNDLLDIAKVEAGRITVNPQEMEIENLFGGLRGMFRPLLLNTQVALIFDSPAGLPKLYTDAGKVSQILRNFISNALKFTERGEVRVSARCDEQAEAVVFSVSDTGIGIAVEDHERIFQEFAQIDNPIQRRVRGTGLGLPLARKLAQLLGGAISLTSALGEGSTFYATIPLRCPGARISTAAAMARTERDPTRIPVLVVEDDLETVQLYEKYLKGTGFQALPASSLAEARQILDEVRPLAIILDIMLPLGPAWDLLLELKRNDATSDIPVFVVSILEEEHKARAFGADEFIRKPLDRRWLVERLQQLCGGAAAGRLLVVDDDEVARYVIRQLLAGTRYQIVEAADGREALDRAREGGWAAILLDLVMPDMSGFEVLERLGADPATRDIPMIVITSKVLTDEERQRLSRAVAVLSKASDSRQDAIARLCEALVKAGASSRPAAAPETPHVL